MDDIWWPLVTSSKGASFSYDEYSLLDIFDPDDSIFRLRLPSIVSEFNTPPVHKPSQNEIVSQRNRIAFKGDTLFRDTCLAVLNECYHKLMVLSSIYKEKVGIVPREQLRYFQIAERMYNRPQFENFVINSTFTSSHKLQRDIITLAYVVREIYDEIFVFGATTFLRTFLENCKKTDEDELVVMESMRNAQRRYERLKTSLKTERITNLRNLKEITNLRDQMINNFKDTEVVVRQEVRFIQHWEKARRDQNNRTLRNKENQFESIIKRMSKDKEVEDECHRTMREYLKLSTEEYLEELESWMNKYDRELEQKEFETIRMKAIVDELLEKKSLLEMESEEREQELVELREQKRLKVERWELENQAATTIQVWWRGARPKRKRVKSKKQKGKEDKKQKGKKSKVGPPTHR